MKKTILITGVTSGIGKALMISLLEDGHHVIGMGRNQERLDHLKKVLITSNLNDFHLIQADFSVFASMDQAICDLKKDYYDGIDVLINNAAIVPKKKQITIDGFEMQFQVNHLAVVKMTHALLPLIKLKQGMILTTSSNAHKLAKFKARDLQALKHYHSLRSYARTKLYNVLFTLSYNERVSIHNQIKAYAVHPGLVKTEIGTKDTSKLYAYLWRKFTKKGFTPEEAVRTYHYLINHQNLLVEEYYYLSQPESISKVASIKENRDLLWKETLKLLAIDFK